MDFIEITRPDDWHLHLRDGEMLARVLPYTARCFGRAIVMPNLDLPVTTVDEAAGYRDRILAALPHDLDFEPLMTLYLTDSTSVSELERAAASPIIAGVKFYPAGATTNSARGVAELATLHPVLEALERLGLPLLVHGEATSPDCDVFDRERVFLENTLRPLVADFPGLRVVFEHITTAEAVAFVGEMPARVAATITPQHLLLNRNAIFEGGLQPHHYCLPVLKRERDRAALVRAATQGDPSFFWARIARHIRATARNRHRAVRESSMHRSPSRPTPKSSPTRARSIGSRALRVFTDPISTDCRGMRIGFGSSGAIGSGQIATARERLRSKSSGPGSRFAIASTRSSQMFRHRAMLDAGFEEDFALGDITHFLVEAGRLNLRVELDRR